MIIRGQLQIVQVSIHNFPCFSRQDHLNRLNIFISKHVAFEPHEVAIFTGCTLGETMEVLELLFRLRVVDQFLLVFHNPHPDNEIEIRPVARGFPSIPMICPECDAEMNDHGELSYGLLFRTVTDIKFVALYGDVH